MMKTIQLITLLLVTLFMLSCSKDDDAAVEAAVPGPANFSEITPADIMAKESLMGTTPIMAVNASGVLFTPGTVLVYKTNENRYGKLEIMSVDTSTSSHKVTFRAINYRADGTVFGSASAFAVQGTYSADLDWFDTPAGNTERDFIWNRQNTTDTRFYPETAPNSTSTTFNLRS